MSSKFNALLFLFFLLTSLYSQGQSQDSLANYSIPTLDSIFQVQKSTEDYGNMIPYAQAALRKAKELYGEKDTCYARMLFNLGYAYDYQIEDYDKAIEYYNQAIAIQKLSKSTALDYSSTLLAVADIYNNNLNDLETAQDLYLQVLEIRKKAVGLKHALYAEAINNLGKII